MSIHGCLAKHIRSSIIIIIVIIAGLSALLILGYLNDGPRRLSIIEFCRRTETADENGQKKDISYVVISNRGPLTCRISNLYLSDSEDDLMKIAISDRQLAPGDKVKIEIPERDSLNIRKQDGARIILSDDGGRIIDTIEIPALNKDEAYVYTGSEWTVLNVGAELVAPPTFSASSGFYDNSFGLELSSPDNNDVYYTLDGSIPTAKSNRYSDVIKVYDRSREENVYLNIPNVISDWPNHMDEFNTTPVDKAFIVRAVCIDDEGASSSVVTNVYFIGLDKFKTGNVVSLIADPEDLFGTNGIYAGGYIYDKWYNENMDEIKDNPKESSKDQGLWKGEPIPDWERHGMGWEREAYLNYFEKGNTVSSQPVGIRIQGHAARNEKLKRFSVYSRKKYSGSRYFDSPIFDNKRTHSFVLREGDANALMQILVSDRDVLTSPVKTTSVFLNGEFWYNTYMLEKQNESLISNRYGVNESNLAIVKNGGQGFESLEGDNPFSGVYDFIDNNDLSEPDKYERFCELIDIQSFIDSSCIQIYSSNVDYQEQWNNYFWHTIKPEDAEYGDSRWRWGMYDMDNYGQGIDEKYGVKDGYQINPFTMIGKWQSEPITGWPLYSSLRKNDDFCRRFVITFLDLVNTDFKYENVRKKMDMLQIRDRNIDNFYRNRADYAISFVADEFELEGTLEDVEVTSDNPDSAIRINTIFPEIGDDKWVGKYFTDYPITVSDEDTGFDHWEIESSGVVEEYYDRTIDVSVCEGGVRIHAVYE